MSVSINSRSYLTADRLDSGSVSGERSRVGANTMARFSAFIMFFCWCSVTLQGEVGAIIFFLNFCWTKIHFVGSLITPISDFAWPSPWASKTGWFSRLHSHLLGTVNVRVISSASPAFSTSRGVHCTSMYTAGLPSRHPSCKQQRAGNGGLLTWTAVRFSFRLPAQQANTLSTEKSMHHSGWLFEVYLWSHSNKNKSIPCTFSTHLLKTSYQSKT